MSHFIFKAKKSNGELYSSERDAADRYELYRLLRSEGDEIVSVEEERAGQGLHKNISLGGLLNRVTLVEKINFARSLSSMLEAGLTLARALSVLERQHAGGPFKKIIADLEAGIGRGETFAGTLALKPKIFPPLFISMVNAGEQSGTLPQSLKTIAAQLESTYALERRVRGALMYPAVILTAMIGIAILMLVFVIPTLTSVFSDLHVPLPLTTRIVIGASALIRDHGFLVLVVVLVLGYAVYLWSRKPSGKRFFHKAMLIFPIVGSLVQEVNAARTARTLSSLLSSGVSVIESLAITESVVQNVHFRQVVGEAKDAIQKGRLMSRVFGEYPKLFPAFFTEMLAVGEETGKIDEMLLNVAKYYEDDVEQKTKDMSTVIEPILIIMIGAAVGFFAVSMISPMYSLVMHFSIK